MKKFMTCQLFTSEEDIDIKSFSFKQSRLLFEDYMKNSKAKFNPIDTTYTVSFEESSCFSLDKVPLILPIKDLSGLLESTLNNLIENETSKYANIIVVDDRSKEPLKSVTKKYKQVSYIRCDYDSGFSYSMIANIAAYICYKKNFKEVIFWNSDMTVPDNKTLKLLIEKHKKNKPVISGTKLLYPYVDWKGRDLLESQNYKFLRTSQDLRGMVQYGGSGVRLTHSGISFFHSKRGAHRDDFYVNVDKGAHMITGAYCMTNLEWFIEIGGFNPSLTKIYNDVDLCLRACEKREHVHYYGKDIFLFHEESTNLNDNGERKVDHQFNSDAILFSKIWNLQKFNNAVGF